MASKAHVFPHHAYGPAVPRQRRPVHFQTHDDPVVLPRSRDWDLSAGLIGAAAIATLLVTGATYAVYYTEPPRLTPTEAPALEREYVPQGDFVRVNVSRALSGPVAAPSAAAQQLSAPAATPSAPSTLSSEREVRIDDSAPGVQESLPQPLENQPSVTPYPDPTTTPPDAIAPAEETSEPDNENPYR